MIIKGNTASLLATSGTFGATVRQSRIGLRTNTSTGIGDI